MLLSHDKFVSFGDYFGKFLGKSIDFPVFQQMSSKISRQIAAEIQLADGSGMPGLRLGGKHSED
jgi:hypothetical protein